MKSRKTKSADLENKRGLYRDIGFVVALALVWVLMSYKSYPPKADDLSMDTVILDEEPIPLTQRQIQPPPPPPQAPPEVLQVVEDEIEIEETVLESTEFEESEEIALIEAVDEVSDEVFSYVNVENRPVFPGCEDEITDDARFQCFQLKLQTLIVQNFNYPELSKQMGSQGKVWIDFVIEKDGSITNAVVKRSSGDDAIDREALRIVRTVFPKMTPAKTGGRAVRMSYTVPIVARLQ